MSDKSKRKTGGDNLPIGNTFVNDGSFLEMFKKRMEEEKNRKEIPNNPLATATTKTLETESKSDQPTTTDKPSESDNSTSTGTKPIIQGFVGKRKALMKASELREKRKKRREQLLEDQEEDKSDAWKAYMAEVKEYQAKNCSEEVHNRPLVK